MCRLGTPRGISVAEKDSLKPQMDVINGYARGIAALLVSVSR